MLDSTDLLLRSICLPERLLDRNASTAFLKATFLVSS